MRQNINFLLIILTTFCLFCSVRPASAAESGTITISGVVLPAKYVYVDENMHITKIISNTPSDAAIVPLSTSVPTQKVSLTPYISRQYTQISKQVNLLKYGQVYPQPKPPVQKRSRLSTVLAQIFRPYSMRLHI